MVRRARTARARSGLPAQPNTLIGRQRELAALLELLGNARVRLVTVAGPAGAGKTRLAVEAAALWTDGTTWFVDLAPILDPVQVLSAIGRATGVREQRGELAPARVARHIGHRSVLLLLDNFEQVLAAATGVADLLAACPNLKILATSRAPLRLRWEHVLRLPPLDVPASRQLPAPDQLAEVPAVALYVERARAVEPSFGITQANAAAVAEICVRLDGLPLAIELAAARSDVFAPAEVLARLRHQFDLLAGGAVDLPDRQRSLEAAFDWGYELLDASDQALFRALGVFVGGFLPSAALAVAGSDDLATLVQHSLVRRDADDGRFRMLETVRSYALERLERCSERQATLGRHARFMLDLAEQAAPQLLGSSQAVWLANLELEHDNLIAALQWALDAGELELSLRLGRALWRFWWLHGHLSEGMHFMDALLSRPSEVPLALLEIRAAVLNGGGVLAHVRGEYDRATSLLEESLELSRSMGLTAGTAAALHNLAALARERGEWSRAQAAYEESLAIEREMGNTWGIATSLINLGALAEDQSEPERAAALLEESLRLMRQIGDSRGIASAMHNLAAVARNAGDWPRAAMLHEESLALWRQLGDRWGTGSALTDLARVTERMGDWRRAARLFGESLSLFGELGIRPATAACLEGLSAVLCDADRPVDAARLLGAADVLRQQTGSAVPSRDRRDLARSVSRARAATREAVFRKAWDAGRALSAEEAAADAVRLVAALTGNELPSNSLTAREAEVVWLIADGLTNRQIAERLVISERTADRHVSNILGKLGLNTRAQVAAWAVQEMGTTYGPLYP